MGLFILIGIILLALLIFGGVFFVKNGKGKLELEIDGMAFTAGETIEGRIITEVRKEMEGELTASLIAVRERVYRDRENQRKTDRDEIFRDEVEVVEARRWMAGDTGSFDFELNVPDLSRPSAEGKLGKVLDVLRDLSSNQDRIIWTVEVRLDVPGLDLVKKKKVSIS